MDNDIHFMRKELDNLQRKVKGFDVLTEYALSESDTVAPTGEWSMDKPSFTDDGFIWVRNTFKTGYGDIVLEPYCIGDGQEHILSLTMEYAVSNDPFTAPTGSWVDVAPTLSTGQYLWTRTVIVTNYGSTTTSPVRLTGEKGVSGDAISIKGDTGDEGKGYDFIYYTSQYDTAPSTPASDVVRTENVYEAWCDYPCSVTDTYKYTYMSIRTSDNGVWGNWSTPTLMSSIGEKGEDGEGYEIIFCQTKTNVPPTFQNGENLHTFNGTVNGKHFNDNDFVPTDWSDDSNGVNSTFKYEYASTRTKTNGVWSDFSSPVLWNIYSESTYTHIRYSAVNNPSSISQTTTTPNSNTQYIGIYVDKKESETFSSYSWKKWIPKEGVDYDGRFLHIKYSNDEGTTMIDTGGSYIGICYSYTDTAPTDPNAYTWSRIRGSDGTGMDFAYYSCANENNDLSAPNTVRTGTPQPNNWYERPYGVTEQIQYCYVSTKPTGGSSWGTPVLWAKYGATGQQGGVGERGEDGIGFEQIFCRTDADGYIVDNTGTRLTINGAVRKLASYSNAQPHTWSAVTTDDYYDETKGWYDNPVGVTENCPYEYVAQRTKTVTNKNNPNQANYKVAVWGKFNVYSQWANYSEDGVGITGTTMWYAQTDTYTNAPTSPSAWREGTPQTYEAGKFYWVKQVIQYDDGTSDETAPLCVSGVDGQSVHFVYYCGNTVPTKPNSSDDVVANGSTSSDYRKWVEDPVSVTSTNPYLFMSQSTDYNYGTGKWTNFSTPAQISTYSTDGTTVKTEWRYLTKADTSTPSTRDNGWSATPVAVTEAKPYCFITSRIVTGNSNGAWTTPVLWSRYANDGDRGTGIFTLTSYTESSASITGNPDVKYKISKSTIQDQIGSITLLVGDQLRFGSLIYPVLSSDSTYYYLGEKSNIRGEKGETGADGQGEHYIYTRTNTNETPSTPPIDVVVYTDDESDTGKTGQLWFEDPQGVTVDMPYEWISKQSWNSLTQEFGNYNTPTLWNYYTKDGVTTTNVVETTVVDETKITGEEIAEKLKGQDINATKIGGFPIENLMTNTITQLRVPTGAEGNCYDLIKMGRLCILSFINYPITVQSTGWYTFSTLPTWAYPTALQYLTDVNGNKLSITSAGNMRINSTTGDKQLAGTFVFIARDDITLKSTNIEVTSNTVVNSYPVIVTLKDSDNKALEGESVGIIINGLTYSRKTDSNGQAGLNINMSGSSHSVQAKYNGSTVYAASISSSKNVTVTACQNVRLVYDSNTKKVSVKDYTNTNSPSLLTGLSCTLKMNNDSYNVVTDAEGNIALDSYLDIYSGTVATTVTTNDTTRTTKKTWTQNLTGNKSSETITLVATPSEINSGSDGRVWTGITAENLANPYDGNYARAYNIASGSKYATLDMLCKFPQIPENATVNRIKITFVYASLLGQTSMSKGSFPAPNISLTHSNNTQIIVSQSIGQAISRTQCGNWYVAETYWDLSASDGKNTSGKWNTIGIRLNSAENGGGGYSNNASYGVDYLVMDITYTT